MKKSSSRPASLAGAYCSAPFLAVSITVEDTVASQHSAIFDVLVRNCGQVLTPDNVDAIMAEMDHEMRHGPFSWAFDPHGSELIAMLKKARETGVRSTGYDSLEAGKLSDLIDRLREPNAGAEGRREPLPTKPGA